MQYCEISYSCATGFVQVLLFGLDLHNSIHPRCLSPRSILMLISWEESHSTVAFVDAGISPELDARDELRVDMLYAYRKQTIVQLCLPQR